MRLFRYLRHHSLKFHLAAALCLGLLFRLCSAYFVFGPQALDDYKHGVLPAYEFFAGLPSTLPDYRSYLLVWILAGFIKLGSFVGASSALAQVRAMYTGLGLISLSALLGVYTYGVRLKSSTFTALGLYLMAVYPVMPFVGTRAFGESVAMTFVTLGLCLAEAGRLDRGTPSGLARSGSLDFWGFLFLGLATLFRFQCGLVFVSYYLIRVLTGERKVFWAASLAGLLTLVTQVVIDAASGRGFLGTLIAYIRANEGGAAQYGVSPWYNTWAFALALTLFPLSLVFYPKVRFCWARHWRILVPMLIFVFVHSLMPHKEERFIYPIVGIVLIALAQVWVWSRWRPTVRWLYTSVFVGVTVIGLIITCFNNTQVGEIGPAAWLQQNYPATMYLDRNSLLSISRIKDYFLRPPSRFREIESVPVSPALIDAEMQMSPDLQAAAVLTSDPALRGELEALSGKSTELTHCSELKSASSLVDALLYRLNPKHNQRRRPTWFIVCERRSQG